MHQIYSTSPLYPSNQLKLLMFDSVIVLLTKPHQNTGPVFEKINVDLRT